jgi:natural product biosynthesis luciferase-like monooxygenase protein/amino acid adenylation domain-containing protein
MVTHRAQDSFNDVLCEQAVQRVNCTALTFLSGDGSIEAEWTFKELDRRARAVGRLLELNGARGQRVLLLFPPGLDYVAAFFGALYAGAVAVPAYPPRHNQRLDRLRSIAEDAQAKFAVTVPQSFSRINALLGHAPEMKSLQWLTIDGDQLETDETWQPVEANPDDLAFLQYTSGSTAQPRGVMVTHANLLHNERTIQRAFDQTEEDIVVSWLPPYHDMGLIGTILQPLFTGSRAVLMSSASFLQRPVLWLETISRYGATTSGGPNFAYELCINKISEEQCAGLDLSRWRVAFNGSEPLRAATFDGFVNAFGSCGFRRSAFQPCYGLAEATLLVSGQRRHSVPAIEKFDVHKLESQRVAQPADSDEGTKSLVGCGAGTSDQEIVIVDPETSTRCAPGVIGEVWIAGPSVTRGYWKRPLETERTFEARLKDEVDGPFLRTGDLAFVCDGELFITGRLKDLIIVRGRNLYPQDIELTTEQSHTALRAGGCAAFSVELVGEERLVVVQEIEPRKAIDVSEIIDTIRQAISEEYELQAYAIIVVKAGTIPKTSSGKIQRHLCRLRFQEDALETVGEWRASIASLDEEEISLDNSAPLQSAEAIERWLALLLAAKLKLDVSQLDVQQPLARYGLDSLLAVELTHNIEAKLGVVLPVVSLLQSPSISQIAAKAVGQLSGTPSYNGRMVIAPVGFTVEHQLSYGQRALWFLHQLAPNSSAYNIARAVRIRSRLNVAALKRAFQILVDRHASLRTTFKVVPGGEPIQEVHEQVEVCFEESNALSWSDEELNERLVAEAYRPVDLESGPLLRVSLFQQAGQEHVLLLAVHHLVADFWSLAVLVNELGTLYLAENAGVPVTLTPLSLRYSDYARWQAELLTGSIGEQLRAFWEQQLAGELPLLNLPTDHPRPPLQTHNGASQPFTVSPELTEGLKAICQSRGTTSFMILLAAFDVLLHHYTGQVDVLVGTPTAGRSLAETAELVGYFVNPVVLRADLSGNPTFEEFLDRVRQSVLHAFEHQDYPFALLIEQLKPERDPSRSPLFQAMLVFQKAQLLEEEGLGSFTLGETGARMQLGGLSIESLALQQRVAQFDLTLTVTEIEKGLSATLEYNTDLFEAATIARMVEHFQILLNDIGTNPSRRISSFKLLTAEERQQLVKWNDTAADFSAGSAIHELFEEQVARTPESVALIFEEHELSYDQLNRRANQLARYLQLLGVGADSRVALLLNRSVEMVVALLAILKAGAAYVPLDPTYPTERLESVIDASGIKVILTNQTLIEGLSRNGAEEVLLDNDWERISQEQSTNLTSRVVPENLAYVIYTSGSTGKPKGVMISHRNVVNFFTGMDKCLGDEKPGVWLAVTSISFDISVLELLWTLSRGFRVVVQREQPVHVAQLPAKKTVNRPMEFSLFYFASDGTGGSENRYRLLFEGSKFADENGFLAVWTPERHFHAFGDLYPNPSVTGAAIAMITKRIQIRAGSVVLPLHHPVRVAEEWAMVDNFSNGRVGISFASGWHADDFVFAPDNYSRRKEMMVREIDTVRRLWRGESLQFRGGAGNEVSIRLLPRPVQPELPIWITAAGAPDTFYAAGEAGAGLLTHLLGQSVEALAERIEIYRRAWVEHGHGPGAAHVTLMLHTFVGEDLDQVRETVRRPFSNYLRSSLGLIKNLALSLGKDIDSAGFTGEDMDAVVAQAFDRYFDTSGLLGTADSCLAMVERLKAIGVDEIACLIDFGVDVESTLSGLRHLAEVKDRSNQKRKAASANNSLATQLRRHRVTHLQCTPSMASMLLMDEDSRYALGAVQKLMLGGEALPVALLERLDQSVSAEIRNMYGPTETTVWSATHLVDGYGATVPIGRPIANTEIYVLNRDGAPAPVGVTGEIYIGGEGVVRGYLNEPELTAEKFAPDPFSDKPGARLYRTGDLGRFLPEGNIEFLGRIDQQVKIRGFRIELEEIENALGEHPAIREAVLSLRTEASGDKRLVAYVVTAPGFSEIINELRRHLSEKLPEYMMPSAFVVLPDLPRTPNGKIDRRSLPAPDYSASDGEDLSVPPRTPVEEAVVGIWTEVLGIGQLGIDDNFFAIGGHSLLATQTVSRIREIFRVELPMRVLFERPTVRSLVEYLEDAIREGQSRPMSAINHLMREADTPLSFAQQRLWFLDQLEPNNAVYNIPASIRLTGPLNIDALERSLNEIIRRQEILRTRFINVEGQPKQFIVPALTIQITISDVSMLSSVERDIEAARLATEEAQQPFDLSNGPLLRVSLLRLGEQDHIALLTMHHIISDAWSMGVLLREVGELYKAFCGQQPSPLPELPIQYADYAAWQRTWVKGEWLREQLDYWREQLSGARTVLELPTDRDRTLAGNYQGATETFAFSPKLSEGIKALSRREGLTPYMTLLAALTVLLYRHTGQEDILIGTPIAGRQQIETEGLIGLFLNTLVLRTDLSGNPDFRELLRQVHEACLGAYTHQSLPFEKLVEDVQPARDLGRTPLFQVMFVLQNAPMHIPDLADLTVSQMQVSSRSTMFDLTFSMEDSEQGYRGCLDYNASLFDATTIQRILGHFENVLESGVNEAGQKIAKLRLLGERERRQILLEWNETGVAYGESDNLLKLFEEQVKRTPAALALVDQQRRLTYAELNQRANQLAHYLRAAGVGAEQRVAVLLPRTTELVVTLLGILKAGGAYVPLEAGYPEERLRFMVEDAGARVLVSEAGLQERWSWAEESSVKVVCVDQEAAVLAGMSVENPGCMTAAANLAYLIYTSGSTGRPKGVAIEHRSASTFVNWSLERFTTAELAVVLAGTSICFDLSVFEIFVPLSCGGTVVLVENPLELGQVAEARQVTLINTVPSAMRELLRLKAVPETTVTVNLAGEALSGELVRQIYKETRVAVVTNLYGPSEDTTYSTCAELSAASEREPSIGRPIANTQAYILDQRLEPVAVGVAGELYLGGAGLARGYFGRPELTAEKFVPHPFAAESGARLYRTGDVARYRSDGELEFLGRMDEQVKVRGYRIELGEIECVLRRHEGVAAAVVVASSGRGESVGRQLVAFVVGRERELAAGELRAHVRRSLPEYMVPGVFVSLAELPLTANGKVDRQALGRLEVERAEESEEKAAARTPIEKVVSGIWSETLGLTEVGVRKNFFELGGHSLLATQVVSRVREVFGVELALRTIFQHPTVEGLATVIEELQLEATDDERLSRILAEIKDLSDAEAAAVFVKEEPFLMGVTNEQSL